VIDYEKIPRPAAFTRDCRRRGLDEKELVLSGGEDYELLFTVSPRREKSLRRTGTGYHIIGRIHRGRRLRVRENGRELPLGGLGFDHFAAAAGKGEKA